MDPIPWHEVKLVVFDVDGTLYRQRPVRIAMGVRLLANAVRRGDVTTMRVLRHYRRLREQLGDEGATQFLPLLEAETGKLAGVSTDQVRNAVNEWIHQRPLRHLAKAAYSGIHGFMDRIRLSGRKVGIFSDYPAEGKLQALGLIADYIVHAEQDDVSCLKPDCSGLLKLMRLAAVAPREAILIGDRPNRDCAAGRRAGVRTFVIGSKGRGLVNGISDYASLLVCP